MKKYVLIFVILLACFAGLNCGAESKCDAGSLDFQTEHVYLKEGKTVIDLRSRKFIPRIRYITGSQPILKY